MTYIDAPDAPLRTASFVLLLLSVIALACYPAAAQPAGRSIVEIDVNQSELIQLLEPATSVLIASPDVADLQVPSATRFVVVGKKPGTTTVFALAGDRRIASYDIVVRRSTTEIKTVVSREFPDTKIDIAALPNGYSISGTVPTPAAAHRLRSLANQFIGEKEELAFNVTVAAASQVTLRVRVAEVSREVSKQFGFNWSAVTNSGSIALGLLTGRAPVAAFGDFLRSPSNLSSLGGGYRSPGGSTNVSALIDALAVEGLVTILAEPNLTAISGETANFLAGGEFPIPISQGNNQVTIEFKRFGISVDFTPVVLSAERLSIKVRPEVSELSDRGAIVVDNIRIPGLSVRRAETTVELGSGQSFAIAGLFQNNVSSQVQRFPWLGDVPILGTLFRSDRFVRNESELVIIVTPYIVRPVSDPAQLRLPTDDLVFSSDLERLLLGRLTAERRRALEPLPRLRGGPGFILE